MKNLAHSIFKELQNKLIIKCFDYSEYDNMPCVIFTHYNGIKSWSHHVNLGYNDNGVYLFSSSMLKKDELKDYMFSDLGHTAIYKIEIKNTSDAIDFLRRYDKFQYKF